MRGVGSLVAGLAMLPAVALAQNARAVDLAQQRDHVVQQVLTGSDTVAEARARWLALMLADDLDGTPGLSDHDRLIREAIRDAAARAALVGQHLRNDLDGDLTISRDEVLPFARSLAARPVWAGTLQVAPTDGQIAEATATVVEQLLAADSSGDGVVTLAEVLALPPGDPSPGATPWDRTRAPFASLLDADGDGIVTEAEFLVPLLAAAARMDTNGDGQLSRIERQLRSNRPVPINRQARRDQAMLDALMPRRGCNLAPTLPDAQVVAIGGYEGAALSNIELGRKGAPAYVVDLVIPPDPRPLAVLLSFQQPVILRLSGAPDRLSEIRTLGASYALVNPPKRPLLRAGFAQGPCKLNMWRTPADGELRETLSSWTGRSDVVIAAGYTIGTVTLGADGAEVGNTLPGSHQPDFGPAAMAVWAEMLRYNPAGLIVLDPATVQSSGMPKFVPPVWPQAAGLAQLVEAGALTPLADRSVQDMRDADQYGVLAIGELKYRWNGGDDLLQAGGLNYTQESPGRWIGRAPARYRINQPMTFPAGMTGGHMAEFLLPQGVPEPEGDRGGSRLRPDVVQ